MPALLQPIVAVNQKFAFFGYTPLSIETSNGNVFPFLSRETVIPAIRHAFDS